jgi:hypothetical protein
MITCGTSVGRVGRIQAAAVNELSSAKTADGPTAIDEPYVA